MVVVTSRLTPDGLSKKAANLPSEAPSCNWLGVVPCMDDHGDMVEVSYVEHWFGESVLEQVKRDVWGRLDLEVLGDGRYWLTFSLSEDDLSRVGPLNPPRMAVDYPGKNPVCVRCSWLESDLQAHPSLLEWLTARCLHRSPTVVGPKRKSVRKKPSWFKDDKKWFVRNRDAPYRRRLPHPDELSSKAGMDELAMELLTVAMDRGADPTQEVEFVVFRLTDTIQSKVPVVRLPNGHWLSLEESFHEKFVEYPSLLDVVHAARASIERLARERDVCFACGHRWEYGDLQCDVSYLVREPGAKICAKCMLRSGAAPQGFAFYLPEGVQVTEEDYMRHAQNMEFLEQLVQIVQEEASQEEASRQNRKGEDTDGEDQT